MPDEDIKKEIARLVESGRAVAMKYVGKPALTRGDCGEPITGGYAVDGYIYVWDSVCGWYLWSRTGSDLFESMGD